ncbi:hypothetical protein [Saccharothrix xinjiangensis]|uniref:Uncharacterized protein n=1 Tax=Saccharothrix xinjiangensis TaxID=204798 RepID=A0ABV9YDT9_9PSEU
MPWRSRVRGSRSNRSSRRGRHARPGRASLSRMWAPAALALVLFTALVLLLLTYA